jgi:hypothetical protein
MIIAFLLKFGASFLLEQSADRRDLLQILFD